MSALNLKHSTCTGHKKEYASIAFKRLQVEPFSSILTGSVTDTPVEVKQVEVEPFKAGFGTGEGGNDFKDVFFVFLCLFIRQFVTPEDRRYRKAADDVPDAPPGRYEEHSAIHHTGGRVVPYLRVEDGRIQDWASPCS